MNLYYVEWNENGLDNRSGHWHAKTEAALRERFKAISPKTAFITSIELIEKDPDSWLVN